MAFSIGVLVGVLATLMITCIIASKKINEAYMDGYNAGRDDALHRVERGVKDE